MANPFPGWTFSRYDMGVDLCGAGKAYYAPASCKRVATASGWDPTLYLFEFDPPLRGTYDNCQYWYVAEGITPPLKPYYKTGEKMGTGTGCNETGWGSPSSGTMTLAGQHGYSGNNLPPGTGTPQGSVYGRTFAQYFGISVAPGAGKGDVRTRSGASGTGVSAAAQAFTGGKDIFTGYVTLRDMPRRQGSIGKFQPPFRTNVNNAGIGQGFKTDILHEATKTEKTLTQGVTDFLRKIL